MEQINPVETKLRIACCAHFPFSDPFYLPVSTIDEAVKKLRKLSDNGDFQSEQFPVPGLKGVAVLEWWDTQNNEWLSYIEESCSASH